MTTVDIAGEGPEEWPDDAGLNSVLGINYRHVWEALGAGNQERRLCGKHAARTAPGFYAYNGTVTNLSRQMDSLGYERYDPSCLPILVNWERRVALLVTSGSPFTGMRPPVADPTTKYPKGELTRKLVSNNTPEGWLPLFEAKQKAASTDDKFLDRLRTCQVWMTLVYFDVKKQEIRSEISKPNRKGIDGRGYVQKWNKRLYIPPYVVRDEVILDEADPNEGYGPNFDLPRR